jgi:arylsulfatase
MSRSAVSYLLGIALAFGGALAADPPAPQGRPSILLILADDLGFSDLGSYGSEISTPNLDRLASRGLRFAQFYNTGRCCPTRAALLTGLYPHQAGVGHMVEDRGLEAYRGFLNDKCITIAEALRKGGYRAYMSGKWHVGEHRPHWPVDRGFERFFGLVSGASNYFRLDPMRTMALDDKPYHPPAQGFYMTDAITDGALGFLEEHGGRPEPFFLFVAYTAPHWPLHALPEDIGKYKGKYAEGWDELRERRRRRMVELGIVDGRWPLAPRDAEAPAWADAKDKEAWDLKMAVYAAQIDRMDQGIGKIVAKLEAMGALESTLILFLADNGGCAEAVDRGTPGAPPGPKESFLSYGLPWANASNTPFRLFKHWVHEGGIATPLIAHWPRGVKKPGTIVHDAGHVIDILPTCLEAAGVEYPKALDGREVLPAEGKSLLPLLRGEAWEGHEALFWEHEGNRAVRRGKWKLAAKFPASRGGGSGGRGGLLGDWELFDLEADRTELMDLSSQHSGKVKELADLYARWAERCGVAPWKDVRDKGPGEALAIYFIDTEGGAATLIVTPLKESLLVDSGNPGERDAGRIARVAREVAGLEKLDHYITTHWHRDHVGGISRLKEMLPVERFYDHGIPEMPGSDILPEDLEAYRRASGGKSTRLRAGDQIELKQDASLPPLKLRIVAADGVVVSEAPGLPQARPCRKGHEAAPEDTSDNARSVAFVLTFGDFDFFDGGDLTWNVEHRLACPGNLVGPVDVFQVNHHGLDLSNHPALVEALGPRVAVVNNGPRKGGEARTFATLKGAPGLEAVFQLHRNVRVAERENAPWAFIANDEEACHADFIKLSVERTGKAYAVAVPAKGTRRAYATR